MLFILTSFFVFQSSIVVAFANPIFFALNHSIPISQIYTYGEVESSIGILGVSDDRVNHPVTQGAFTLATSVIPVAGITRRMGSLSRFSSLLVRGATRTSTISAKTAVGRSGNVLKNFTKGVTQNQAFLVPQIWGTILSSYSKSIISYSTCYLISMNNTRTFRVKIINQILLVG
ncbi:MAG: hypothetical protein AAF620_19385 [Bacteroidota bacterium]